MFFDMAVNAAWCGRYPYVTSTKAANREKIDLITLTAVTAGDRSVQRLIGDAVGSLQEYCRMEGHYYATQEPSTALIESVLLRLDRQATMVTLARVLKAIAMAGFVLFALALIRLGWPAIFAASVTLVGVYLTVLLGGNALYSQYPLLLPMTLVEVAIGALCLSYGMNRRLGQFVSAALALGLWTGFVGNLRTSLYPTAALTACLFVAFGVADWNRAVRPSRRRLAGLTVSVLAALVFGVVIFDQVWVAPMRAVASASSPTYHVIAHPLVLGLATPPNALAEREDIKWNDRNGVVLAKRINPKVTYLGPGYERALFTYYERLWAAYPAEMFQIYVTKFRVIRSSADEFLSTETPDIFWSEKDGRWLPLAAAPAIWLARVLGMIGLFVGMFVLGCCRPKFLALDGAKGFVVASLAIAGVLGCIESAVVLSGVVLWYSSVYVFAYVFAGLVAWQAMIDAGWLRLSRRFPAPVADR